MARPPAPKIDHPYVFSVSQIETFELCNRKWAFDKLDGIPAPPNKFAELGQRVHDVLEMYLSKNIAIDESTVEGRIAAPGLRHLPFPKTPGMRVEKWFSIIFGVAAYRGLKDVEIIVDGKRPLVLDHKTTRNFAWKKTKRELLTDTQSGVYAAHAMRKTGASEVDLRWVYYKTEGGTKSEPVDVVINREQVAKILTRTNETAKKIIHVIQTCSKAMEVTPNYRSCSAFGGCGHRERCAPEPVQRLKAIMAQKTTESQRNNGKSTSDFLKVLEDRKNKKSGGTKTTAAKPPEVTVEDVVLVNSADREEFEQPPPPPPKKINGKYVNPIWDEAAAEWTWPEGVEDAEKQAAAAAAASAKKGAKDKAGKGGATSAKEILEKAQANKPRTIATAEARAEDEADEAEVPEGKTMVLQVDKEAVDWVNALLDVLADKIAARLRK